MNDGDAAGSTARKTGLMRPASFSRRNGKTRPAKFDPPPVQSWETDDVRWIRALEVHTLDLFPEFGVTLRKLGFRYTHDELYPPTGLRHPSYLLAPAGTQTPAS